MSTNEHTLKTALDFILSPEGNFRPTAQVVYLDARNSGDEVDWANHPRQRLINQSPGGRSVEEILKRSEMTDDEKRRVLRSAVTKFIDSTSRDVEVIVDDQKPRVGFLRYELPLILENEGISHLNGVPRRTLAELHAADPHAEKVTALNVIVNSLRERSLVTTPRPDTDVSRPPELKQLESEVDKLVGGTFREHAQRLKVAEGDLNRAVLSWNAYTAEREALGWEKLLPTVRLRLMTERWAKKRELRTKRRTLDTLHSALQREEKALLRGRYTPQLESALERVGVKLATLYGPEAGKMITQAIERSLLKHKSEAERFDIAPKEARRPRAKPRL